MGLASNDTMVSSMSPTRDAVGDSALAGAGSALMARATSGGGSSGVKKRCSRMEWPCRSTANACVKATATRHDIGAHANARHARYSL